MGDQVLITGGHLKVVNQQRKRIITPDVILYTRNVMIPVVKSVPLKQTFDIPVSKKKPEILRMQNYRNNPALQFAETPLHTLYTPLKNLFEVKRPKSIKCTVSGKRETDSPSIEKKSILQNSCFSNESSRTKKSNMLHFPNTMQFQPSRKDENLHKISSKDIKLSRKCNLSQMRKDQIRYEGKSLISPKIETRINDFTSKSSTISLQSQSFHNFTDIVSAISIPSVSGFKLENKKTFANIENINELISKLTPNHLQPNNSEYELNVLHYENDNLLENNLSQSHLKSVNTNLSSTDSSIKMQDAIKIPANDKDNGVIENATENCYRWDPYEIISDIKYSWKANNWMPASQKKECNYECKVKDMEIYSGKSYDCKVKYSWQVIGTGAQTSCSLLQDLLNDIDTEDNKSEYKMRNVKYSWQIIGISTQASLHDCNDGDYWNGMLLAPNKNHDENNVRIETDCARLQNHSAKDPEKRSKKYLILNNQQTQTFAEKEVQADPNDHNAKYSWHNLIKQYL